VIAGDVADRREDVQNSGRRRHDVDGGWEDKVRLRAYALWEGEGQPEGGAERHWAEAEEELRAQQRDRTDLSAARAARAETRTEPARPSGRKPQAGSTAGETLRSAQRSGAWPTGRHPD
jgi:hypothetical protein